MMAVSQVESGAGKEKSREHHARQCKHREPLASAISIALKPDLSDYYPIKTALTLTLHEQIAIKFIVNKQSNASQVQTIYPLKISAVPGNQGAGMNNGCSCNHRIRQL